MRHQRCIRTKAKFAGIPSDMSPVVVQWAPALHEPVGKRGAESFLGVRQVLFTDCADGPAASDVEEPLDFRRAQRPGEQAHVIQPDESLVTVMVCHPVDAGDRERVDGLDCTNGWTECRESGTADSASSSSDRRLANTCGILICQWTSKMCVSPYRSTLAQDT